MQMQAMDVETGAFGGEQARYEAGKFATWLILGAELLLFGAVISAYIVTRANHGESFRAGSDRLFLDLGVMSTIAMVLTSVTMAGAVSAAQRDKRAPLMSLLVLTLVGGLAFLGLRGMEYSQHADDHLVWGLSYYQADDADAAEAEGAVRAETIEVVVPGAVEGVPASTLPTTAIGPAGLAERGDDEDEEADAVARALAPAEAPHVFWGVFYATTGMHCLHVIGVLIALLWILLKLGGRDERARPGAAPVDHVGLFWHMGTIVWMFLFPLLYLVR
jgi:cytochrome c oxidase subunit 3